MKGNLSAPIEYHLTSEQNAIILNHSLGKKIKLEFLGEIHCIQCGRITKKSFEQGHCYPCMLRLQECNCILRPERCRVEEGKCSKEDWAHVQCDQEHIIYLANSSGLKVGITRATNTPGRWIDQGAIQAIPIMRVMNRYQAGMVEVALKEFVADRTNWREMLKRNNDPIDLIATKTQLLEQAKTPLKNLTEKFGENKIHVFAENQITQLNYPILKFPEKIQALSLDKTPEISGTLLGIKGQYWILDCGVINIRKFSGYRVNLALQK